jgi:hypothetical protein
MNSNAMPAASEPVQYWHFRSCVDQAEGRISEKGQLVDIAQMSPVKSHVQCCILLWVIENRL